MRISFFVAWITIMFLVSCRKLDKMQTEQLKVSEIAGQQHPVCGMEDAMANMSAEMRQSLLSGSQKTEIQASELLLYLDFDGMTVIQGNPNPAGNRSPIINGIRNCPPPSLTGSQIGEVIELVKDDYSPFNIRITTDYAEFLNYPSPNKQICIITTVPQVIGMGGGVGGVSPFLGLGIRLPFNPSFVFADVYFNDLAEIASTISHETGHSMGLGHQSLYNPGCGYITEYHPGFGTGPISFGPIMGLGGKRIANWFAQSCIHPLNGGSQNDFNLLNSQVQVKEDDYPDDPSGNLVSATTIDGILETEGDADFIKINFKNPGPVTITSENIDIRVSVYTNGGHLMDEYNDPGDTHVTIPAVSGLRYLKIEAAGNENMSAQFMTGKYRISY